MSVERILHKLHTLAHHCDVSPKIHTHISLNSMRIFRSRF
jgi:hypothetical protein